jgi:DnaK suppressor protein
MDEQRARELLSAERARVEQLIRDSSSAGEDDRTTANQFGEGDIADPAERLTAEEVDDAISEELRGRLQAIERAEARLEAGTYGRSINSGQPIPDERLEADPAAELTADEAAANQ